MTKTHLWPQNAARAVEDEYANHPLYQALRPIVLDFSTKAQQLSWSPSELFYHTLYTLDKLCGIAVGDERVDYCRSAWNEIYAYICERSDADDGERRLMATQLCVAVNDCLYVHNRLTWFKEIQTLNEAACVGYGKTPMELSYAFLPLVDENRNARLKAWLTEYLDGETALSDEIEGLLDNKGILTDRNPDIVHTETLTAVDRSSLDEQEENGHDADLPYVIRQAPEKTFGKANLDFYKEIVAQAARTCYLKNKPAHLAYLLATCDDYGIVKDRYRYLDFARTLVAIGAIEYKDEQQIKNIASSISKKMTDLPPKYREWKDEKERAKCEKIAHDLGDFVHYRY